MKSPSRVTPHHLQIDRLPPHSIEAEQGVLGCILHSPLEGLEHCAALDVQPESFYDLRHRSIYEGLVRLCLGAKAIDLITLQQHLKDRQELEAVGGLAYLSELPDKTPSAANITHYIDILNQKAVARKAIALCSQAAADAFERTPENWLADFRDKVIQLRIGSSVVARPIGELVRPPDDDPTQFFKHRWVCECGSLLINGPTGMGKCVKKNTPILMFDGTLRMSQEIRLGDILMGPDSLPRTVLGTTSGIDELYQVTQKQGDSYTVNSAHILALKITGGSNLGSKIKDGQIVELPVSEYLKKSKTFKHCAKGWKVPISFPSRDVPLPPYFLGLWLGDGTSSNSNITTGDPEIELYLESLAQTFGLRIHKYQQRGARRIALSRSNGQAQSNPILNQLRSLAILNNKHIPHLYKCNSKSVRLEVLAGLLDTDGHYECGCFRYTSKSERLANDAAFLARSVGFAATITSGFKKCQNGNGGTFFFVTISGDVNIIPTRIARKQAKPRRQKKNVLLTGIKVESVGRGEYYGFEIDGDGRFLLGDFTVTHNSSFVLQGFALWANQLPFFGIHPSRPLRAILIQAENDDGDLAEMRDGICDGLKFTREQRANFFTRVLVFTSNGTVGRRFCNEVVQPMLISHKPNLLGIDPANSFIGGDTKEQKDVGAFLRTWLNPLLHAHRAAAVIVHHTNKPTTGKEKPNWKNGELAYTGSGSAEWANWARAVLAIQDTGTHGIYRLHAAKRGVRLHWRNPGSDEPVYEKLIGHATDGHIYWRDAEETEVKDTVRSPSYQPDELTDLLSEASLSTTEWCKAASAECGMSSRTFYRAIRNLNTDHRVLKSKVTGKWSKILPK